VDGSQLIQNLVKKGVLKTPAIIEAFKKIDRADFLLPRYRAISHSDQPLPIGQGQTNSQPTTVAFMLELLQPQPGDRILDVGSGSGWTTALLAHIVGRQGRVVGVEIVPELVAFGKRNLSKYDMSWADILPTTPGVTGLPQEVPYDKILVSAAATQVPSGLLEQLEIGGRLVIPVMNSIFKIDRVSEDDFDQKEFYGFNFVPLVESWPRS